MEKDMIEKIIKSTNNHNLIIAQLRKDSKYYPEIIIENYDSEFDFCGINTFASTLVRINKNGIWFVVHCVESLMRREDEGIHHLLFRLIKSVHNIQHLYKIPFMDEKEGAFEIDILQQDEAERLQELMIQE